MSANDAKAEVVIQPSRGWAALNLRETWAYRELLLFFTWRDLKVRYKQTLLGASWALVQPALTVAVFTLFFGRLAGIDTGAVPYPLFSFAGVMVWGYFAGSVTRAATSLVGQQNLLKKVYFPRLIVPVSSVFVGLVDLLMASAALACLMAFYGVAPTARVAALPGLVALAVLLALGVGLWLSALNVKYRDVGHMVPFLMQTWMFLSPVIYPSALVPQTRTVAGWEIPARALYGLNPMAGVLEGARWSLFGVGSAPGAAVLTATIVALVLLFTGAAFFRRMERDFADLI
ncbi:MAG: ABC transporter permease [Planctomycetes bacterium]|nr:ABC transporter permease [Planctomycetota bacterium]